MNLDPLNINARLYNQVSELLGQLEHSGEKVTLKERIAAMIAIARIQTVFMTMRLKGEKDESTTGSAVRKYAGAFQAHDARRRKATARAAAAAAGSDDEIDLDAIGFGDINDDDNGAG
jgi:hypothetical protein